MEMEMLHRQAELEQVRPMSGNLDNERRATIFLNLEYDVIDYSIDIQARIN